MKKSDRKKMTTNEIYLNECMKILGFKTRAIGLNFHDDKGNVLLNNIVNFEDDEHETITVVSKPNMKKILLDGTNYSSTFFSSKNDELIFRNKQLDIEYISKSKNISDGITIKTLIRRVGDTTEYFKYLYCDNMCVVLDYRAKDENGTTIVVNNIAQNLSEEELITYAVEEMAKYKEIEKNLFGEELDDFDSIENSEGSTEAEIDEEIDTFVNDDFESYYTIDYISKAMPITNNVDDDKCGSDLPFDVTSFDYEDDNISSDNDNNVTVIAEQCISEEGGFIDSENYSVIVNDTLIEDEMIESDFIDTAVTQTMDVNQEVEDLMESYTEIKTDFNKIKNIIVRRKKKLDSQGDTFGNIGSDRSELSNEFGPDI
ncbi:MAG: hypothetical protein J6J36_08405 [Clostridia bacterium]|nr:hypothetical protein [Clostridia bacterium]